MGLLSNVGYEDREVRGLYAVAQGKQRWRELKVVCRNSSDGVQMSVIQMLELTWCQLENLASPR